MKFRLPRKIKKKLTNRTVIYFYPPMKNGNRRAAFPYATQEDYTAYKAGKLETPFNKTKREQIEHLRNWSIKFKTPVEISDEELLMAVNEIFAEEYQNLHYQILIKAKNDVRLIEDYYIFVNAWLATQSGDDYSMTACLAIDSIIHKLRM